MKPKSLSLVFAATVLLSGLYLSSCRKTDPASSQLSSDASWKEPQDVKGFMQVNLVANNSSYGAAHVDPHLVNAWGIAFNGTNAIPWVSSEGAGYSSVYDRAGNFIAARPEVTIPTIGSTTGGHPTGAVFNIDPSSTHFLLSNNVKAAFLFVGVDGILSGWNGAAGNSALTIHDNHATAAYTGLAMASSGGQFYLYAANFMAGTIDVFDQNFNMVSMPFTDPDLPAGYAPFNIQRVGSELYVMYAEVGDDGEEETGPGKGYVDVFATDGTLLRRFASRGQLNAPWGVTRVPADFMGDGSEPAILVGNFGDGHINAYNTDGRFMGQLRTSGNPVVIEGLWAITYVPAISSDPVAKVYFAAGPNDEADGLFGYLVKQ